MVPSAQEMTKARSVGESAVKHHVLRLCGKFGIYRKGANARGYGWRTRHCGGEP